MAEFQMVKYEGLEHWCDDPDCHVRGFVTTLILKGSGVNHD